ncbi:unnamed protein product [Linum trigynum]|uniref:Uncharacterized protein n=1 Tax=Linum trigynum TaxID=586398 RepID=A0AAV2F2V9_9ROSI
MGRHTYLQVVNLFHQVVYHLSQPTYCFRNGLPDDTITLSARHSSTKWYTTRGSRSTASGNGSTCDTLTINLQLLVGGGRPLPPKQPTDFAKWLHISFGK